MKLLKFNEMADNKPDVRVKDLINFLEIFDPETPVYLDKDGWQPVPGEDVNDTIRQVIDDSAIHRGKNCLFINN